MLLYLIVITVGFLSSIETGSPRKLIEPSLNNYENYGISPLVDPYDGISYRLPNDTVPLTYDIFLSTDIHRGEFAFNGNAKIRFEVIETTNQVTLHYRQMNIHNVTLFNSNNQIIQENVPWIQNATVEFLIIRPNMPFFVGQQYIVHIFYSATIRDDSLGKFSNSEFFEFVFVTICNSLGWYRASYISPRGDRRWLATTQFQANEARHAFPCWDEPGRRSLFTIAIKHDASYIALSNMPEVSRSRVPDSNYVITRFAQTLSMQSYLVAFTVSDFIYVEEALVVPPQRIYGKRQSIENGDGDMALAASVKIMAEFEKYLQIPYSFPKMDQFACPDFAFGGKVL
jgi:aminopeptidase N